MIESRRPDIVVVLKKGKECKIIDIAVPGDSGICETEMEKIEEYELKREIQKLCTMWNVEVIGNRISGLGNLEYT